MRTLVLNKNWMPITHISWKRAFILLCKGSAEILESYDDMIKGPRDSFYYVPAVIRLLSFDSIPKSKVSYSKRSVLERDRLTCQYCGRKLNYSDATIDHVIPRCKGGRSTFDNTVTCCSNCNKRKADKLPEEARLKLLAHPRKPNQNEYEIYLPRTIHKVWASYIPRGMLENVQVSN